MYIFYSLISCLYFHVNTTFQTKVTPKLICKEFEQKSKYLRWSLVSFNVATLNLNISSILEFEIEFDYEVEIESKIEFEFEFEFESEFGMEFKFELQLTLILNLNSKFQLILYFHFCLNLCFNVRFKSNWNLTHKSKIKLLT